MTSDKNALQVIKGEEKPDISHLSSEEKELLVPASVKTPFGFQHYDPAIMQRIILDIATSRQPVKQIIKSHGMADGTVYLWRSVSSQLLSAWRAAMRHRTHTVADDFETEVQELNNQVENDDNYKRTSNRIRRFDRVWGHRQWFMSRYNRQDFGDKVDIEQNITIAPAKAREEAYTTFQNAQVADFEEVTLPPINQIENDSTS
jgi:transposase-like protein